MERLKTVWQLREGSKRKTEFYDFMNFLDKSVDPDCKVIPDEIVQNVLPEELNDVLKIVVRGTKLSTIDLGYDLHSGNVMIRANGEFVITDPLCDTEYLEF
jgi:formylmethanofuran:tetrahydromethanopterin formyltransferase